MRDYIPQAEGKYAGWTTNFVDTLPMVQEKAGVPQKTFDDIKTKKAKYDKAYRAAAEPGTRSGVSVEARRTARAKLTAAIRPCVRLYLATNPDVTDAERVLLGITVRKKTRTRKPKAVTAPIFVIDLNVHGRVGLRAFFDLGGERSRSKGGQAALCVVSQVGGELPVRKESMGNAVFITNGKHVFSFDEESRGKPFYLAGFWVSPTGEAGPWSEMIMVMSP
jgi:hypothetical protein